jgi:hypothetical protein
VDVASTYRLDLYKAFQSKYPQFPVTTQNLADQRRAIMKKNYIPSAILEKIKNDVKLELSKFLIIYSKILLNRKVYKVYLIIMTLSVQFSIHQTTP